MFYHFKKWLFWGLLLSCPGWAEAANIYTVAGGGVGDGRPAAESQLSAPTGTALDQSGNLFIIDRQNHRVLKVDAGTGTLSTIAGTGFPGFSGDNGLAGQAQLNAPFSLVLDPSGNLYIADRSNHRVRKVDAITGRISTIAGNGTAGFSGDGGPGTAASLNGPSGLAMDPAGNLYIADALNNRIRKLSASGVISTVAGTGAAGFSGDEGPALFAQLAFPLGVTLDTAGGLYIADANNHRIRKVDITTGMIHSVAGTGTAGFSGDNGPAASAALNTPSGVFYGGGILYIADSQNNRIRKVVAGNISTIAGGGTSGLGDGGGPLQAQLAFPEGMYSDHQTLFIADTNQSRVRKVDFASGVISTVAGNGTLKFAGDGGSSHQAHLYSPGGLALDASGNLYIADRTNHRVRKVDAATGVISTVAGTGTPGYSGDGGPAAQASLNAPSDLAFDVAGNLFMSDRGNHRVRKFDPATGLISTVAGTGIAGFSGDNGPGVSAQLNTPSGLAMDALGNLYIADRMNHRIRRLNTMTGIISTIAGNTPMGYAGSFSGDDGPATLATLNRPSGVSLDLSGNLYIADTENNRIRTIAAGADGIITGSGDEIIQTKAGGGSVNLDDGNCATYVSLTAPPDVEADPSGTSFYIADSSTHRIRQVTPAPLSLNCPAGIGSISTVAGTRGMAGFSGDGGSAVKLPLDPSPPLLNGPASVARKSSGDLFIADSGNDRVRMVSDSNQPPFFFSRENLTLPAGTSRGIQVLASGPEETDPLSLTESFLPPFANLVDNGDGSAMVTVSPPGSEPSASYNSLLHVSDGITSVSSPLTITVLALGNQAPLLNPIGALTVAEGSNLRFTISGSDPDGDALSYSTGALPVGATFDAVAHTFDWTPGYTQAGSYNVTFTLTDNGTPNLSASETITITVNNTNRPPVLNPIGTQSVAEGTTLTFTIGGSDPDGDALTYSTGALPSGATFDAATRTFDWTPGYRQASSYNVTFTVTDTGTPNLSASETITITVSNTNQPPVLNAIGNRSVAEGSNLNFTVSGSDPDGDVLTYSTGALPSGTTFDAATRTFDWTPGYAQSGSYNVTFTVMDGGIPDLNASETITITVSNVNRLPVLGPIGSKTVAEGSNLNFTVSGSDPDGDVLMYSTGALPSGATFDATTRTFDWTPGYAQSGSNNVTFTVTDNGTPNLSASETITITVSNTNQPPVLNAIGNRSVAEGSNLNFTVSGSDPDGDVLTYSTGALPSGTTFDAATRTFDWTPGYAQSGSYNVTFTVMDAGTPRLSVSDIITITVNNTNRPPVLNPIGAHSVAEGATLTFTIGGSDPDGDALTYSTGALPPGATFDAATRTFDWTPGYAQSGSYNVTFTVMDSGTPNLSASEIITIMVSNTNQPPVLNAIGNKSVSEGANLNFTVGGSDPDGDALTYSTGALPPGATFDAVTRTFDWTPGYAQSGSYNVTITVADGGIPDLSASETITITVSNTNQPPVLNEIGNRSVAEGSNLNFAASSSDPDGDHLTYSTGALPSGAMFNATTQTFDWTPGYAQAGSYNVTFTVTDNGTPNLSVSETITITVNNTNRPPVLNPIGTQSVAEGATLTFTIGGSDPDGDPLTYSTWVLPSWATFNAATRTFDWTPGYTQAGNYSVTFTVTDAGTPNLSASETITITVSNTNQPPLLNPVGDRSVAEGTNLNFTISGSDPDGDMLTYSTGILPSGVTFDAATRTLDWTPRYTQAGSYSVTFTVTDNGTPNLSASETITITVSNTNRPPVLNTIGSKSVAEGENLNFTVSGSDPDGDTLTYSTGVLPSGATFDMATRTLDWTPGYAQSGSYNATFTVMDSGTPNLSVSETISIMVNNTNRPPVLNPIGTQSVAEGATLTFTTGGSDPDGDALAYNTGALPPGATFDTATRTFDWTPGYTQSGSYNVTFTVMDGGIPDLSASETITITVSNTNQPPGLNAIGNKSVSEGSNLNFTISGSDPDGDVLTYSTGALPSGATFDTATRTFDWTPGYVQAGSYNVTFMVIDGNLSASEAITITVTNTNQPPVLTPIGSQSVSEGLNLNFTIRGSDPDGDALTYSATGLPTGATFDAVSQVFDWTPSYGQTGNYNIAFTVSDGMLTSSETVSITVTNFILKDDFNRTDSTELGGNWTEFVLSGGQAGFSIEGNRLVGRGENSGSTAQNSVFWGMEKYKQSFIVRVRLGLLSPSSNPQRWSGLLLGGRQGLVIAKRLNGEIFVRDNTSNTIIGGPWVHAPRSGSEDTVLVAKVTSSGAQTSLEFNWGGDTHSIDITSIWTGGHIGAVFSDSADGAWWWDDFQTTSFTLVGYASEDSVPQGGMVHFHVSTDSPTYDLLIYREGATREWITSVTGLPGTWYPVPGNGYEGGFGWPVVYTLAIPLNWKSGIYRADLVSFGQALSSVWFVVREDRPGSTSRILLESSINTLQAYDYFGGKSLYPTNSSNLQRAYQVSFDRPVPNASNWEMSFIRWAEASGYTLEYATNVDLHRNPNLLQNYQLLVSVGHDEYWSKEMRDQVESFVSQGGNVAFLSANTSWWQVRFEDNNRIMVCYKNRLLDPLNGVDDNRVTVKWYSPPLLRPENAMTGVSFRNGGYPATPQGYTVYNSDHWIYDGTGMTDGTVFGALEKIVDYEVDGAVFDWQDGRPLVTGTDGTPSNFIVLGMADAKTEAGLPGHATMGMYSKGGNVFTAATTQWALGLDRNPTVQQMTRNILDRFTQPYRMTTLTRFEEEHPALNYTGTWNPISDPQGSGGSYKVSTEAGSHAVFHFWGTEIYWVSSKRDDNGIARVSIDGLYDTTVDLYSPVTVYPQVVYGKRGLPLGIHTIMIEVTGTASSNSLGFNVGVDAFDVVSFVNLPPALKSIGTQVVNEGTRLNFTISGSDPDGDALTFSASGLPTGATFDVATGTFDWTPGYTQAGSYNVTFTVSDGGLGASEVVTITVSDTNRTPLMNPIGDRSVAEGATLIFTVSGSDPDGDALTYNATGLPAGATFDSVTRTFEWAPGNTQAGSYLVTFALTDGSLTAGEEVTITVTPVNQSPHANDQSISVMEDTDLSLLLTGYDPDGDPLVYTVISGPLHGTLSGIPPALIYRPDPDFNGLDRITFTVDDGPLTSGQGSVFLTIIPVNDPPVSGSQELSTGEDVAIDVTLTAVDADADPLHFTVVGGPAHGSLSGIAPHLTYTPDPKFKGPDSFRFKADDTLAESPMATVAITVFSPGDLDGSGRIDGFDLGKLGLAFGSQAGDENWNPLADLNGDGIVDGSDLTILGAHFGKNGSSGFSVGGAQLAAKELPPPLWGRAGEGGEMDHLYDRKPRKNFMRLCGFHDTPHPNPPPQGGRELCNHNASTQIPVEPRKLTEGRA